MSLHYTCIISGGEIHVIGCLAAVSWGGCRGTWFLCVKRHTCLQKDPHRRCGPNSPCHTLQNIFYGPVILVPIIVLLQLVDLASSKCFGCHYRFYVSTQVELLPPYQETRAQFSMLSILFYHVFGPLVHRTSPSGCHFEQLKYDMLFSNIGRDSLFNLDAIPTWLGNRTT